MKHLLYKSLLLSSILLFIGSCLFTSCNDDVFSTNPNDKLTFSVDTVHFDTVFTTVSSSMKRIMVYNKNKKNLRISHIGLEKGSNSAFQINVDGTNSPDHQVYDIEINAKDSAYIFVAVKVDVLNSNSPELIEDKLRFETNGMSQEVVLRAYGQDVEFFRKKIIYNDTTLTADKPYVIYDTLFIAPEKTLTLAPGTRLYFHNKAAMIMLGNLHALGEYDNPVTIRGDRFDNIGFSNPIPYNAVAGQWDGIYLLGHGANHILKHVNMNSGDVGIYMSDTSDESVPSPGSMSTLQVINSRIHNFLHYGLVINNANATVINSEISNTGDYTVYLDGGKHTFVHTTIANYFGSGKSATQSASRPAGSNAKPAVIIMDLNKSAHMETSFINSVIMGSMENEFSLATRFPEQYKGEFKNTYIRKKEALEYPQFENIRWYQKNDTVFESTQLDYEKNKFYNFAPDSVSPSRGLGTLDVFGMTGIKEYLYRDLNGNDRPTSEAPDAGAYQWMPTHP